MHWSAPQYHPAGRHIEKWKWRANSNAEQGSPQKRGHFGLVFDIRRSETMPFNVLTHDNCTYSQADVEVPPFLWPLNVGDDVVSYGSRNSYVWSESIYSL